MNEAPKPKNNWKIITIVALAIAFIACTAMVYMMNRPDVIAISPLGEGMAEALKEIERAAAYRGLTPKESLRLQLLGEEMMGMLRTIVGEGKSSFWVEAEGKTFSLHLRAGVRMNADLRDDLLKAATSGKNAAVKGFMGRIRDIFTQLSEPDGATMDWTPS